MHIQNPCISWKGARDHLFSKLIIACTGIYFIKIDLNRKGLSFLNICTFACGMKNRLMIHGKTGLIALLAISSFVCLFFFLRMNTVFFSGPAGIHIMRQTDSMSFASQYYNKGFHFFKPQLFNLKNSEGKAACEFPLLYYITALLYLIFGKNYLILKLLNLLILYLGIFNVFRLAYGFLKDYFYAALIALFLFTSTVFNYYSFNYLPDTAALGFVFSAWYYIFRYISNGGRSDLFVAFIFFLLGSLIKVTYLVNPLSIMAVALFLMIKGNEKYFSKEQQKSIIWIGLSTVVLTGIWNLYVLWYNASNDSHSFNTTILPIWNLSQERILVIWHHMRHYWHVNYFYQSSFHLLFVFVFFQIITLRKANFQLILLLGFLFIGGFFYWMLFYSQFQDHDYYFLAFFPVFVFLILSAIKTLQSLTSRKVFHIALKIIMSVIVVAGINYSRMKLSQRYLPVVDKYSKTSLVIQNNNQKIQDLRLAEDATFLVVPDPCQNSGLFFLDRMGWTLDSLNQFSVDTVHCYIRNGADYLFLASSDSLYLSMGAECGAPILVENDFVIFSLKKY